MEVLAELGLQETLAYIGTRTRMDMNGHSVRLSSVRLRTFKKKGTDCCICGAKGLFWRLERSSEKSAAHLNLYAMHPNGTIVLMTRDHILADCKGGPNTLDNMQPMCVVCNTRKGHMSDDEFKAMIRKEKK